MEILGMQVKHSHKIAAIIVFIGLIVFVAGMLGAIGHNNLQNFQVCQSLTGNVWIQTRPGYYWRGWAKVWTYPLVHQTFYSATEGEGGDVDESIRVTFNDSGEAKISTMVMVMLPTDEPGRLKVHQTFRGEIKSIENTVRSHLINCIKSTGPVMSASENQSARKAEFTQLVDNQLRDGLYAMRRVERIEEDQNQPTKIEPETGIVKPKTVTRAATEILTNEKGQPIIAQPSPLKEYNITVAQFSVTETEYDETTRKLFAAKKESYLMAEKMKAQQQEEIANRRMVIERGLREKAETEAKSNQERAKQTIEAEMRVSVAQQQKIEAETVAKRQVEIAIQKKLEAETEADMRLAVAKLAAQEAEQKATAIKTLAAAERERIDKAGAITEKEQTLATINANKEIQIAVALANIKTPATLVVGGGADGKGSDLMSNMVNLLLMRQAGVIGNADHPAPTTQPAGK